MVLSLDLEIVALSFVRETKIFLLAGEGIRLSAWFVGLVPLHPDRQRLLIVLITWSAFPSAGIEQSWMFGFPAYPTGDSSFGLGKLFLLSQGTLQNFFFTLTLLCLAHHFGSTPISPFPPLIYTNDPPGDEEPDQNARHYSKGEQEERIDQVSIYHTFVHLVVPISSYDEPALCYLLPGRVNAPLPLEVSVGVVVCPLIWTTMLGPRAPLLILTQAGVLLTASPTKRKPM
jgi:hypothetical protein